MRFFKNVNSVLKSKGGFGVAEVLGIAAAFIVAAFVMIPGLKELATTMMDGLKDWFTTTISNSIFLNS